MNDVARNGRIDLARKRVHGYCRGLLESSQDGTENPTLGFTHTSIPEFLEKPHIQKDMNFHLKDFDPVDAISKSCLRKCRPKIK